mmetsp:Transcript_66796/g.118246  ORF Transcript_66796/g.118246 Transcript_66796/m.118246 type:complete len:205 (-) Transcript_66796:959-1573(-)
MRGHRFTGALQTISHGVNVWIRSDVGNVDDLLLLNNLAHDALRNADGGAAFSPHLRGGNEQHMLFPIEEENADSIDTEEVGKEVLHALLKISECLCLVHINRRFLDCSCSIDDLLSLRQLLDVHQHSADESAKKAQESNLRIVEASAAIGSSVLGHNILKYCWNESHVAAEGFLVLEDHLQHSPNSTLVEIEDRHGKRLSAPCR